MKQIKNYLNSTRVQAGVRLLIAAAIVSLNPVLAALVATFPSMTYRRGRLAIGFGWQFDKAGLKDDSLKFIEDLEKRMTIKGEPVTKEEVELQVREMMKKGGVDLDKLKELNDEGERGIRSIVAKLGTQVTQMEKGVKELTDNGMSIRAQVAKWQETNKAAIDTIRSGQEAKLTPLEIRVASPMTPANTYGANAYVARFEGEAGVTDPVRRDPTFWDYIRKGSTSSPVYYWVNKVNPLGAAAFIGPGVAKPGISFELESAVSNAKKIAVSLKTTTELLQDIDGMTTFIEQELRYALDDETNLKLMTGVVSGTVPAGIQTLSVAYSLVGVETQNPNNWDAIVAGVAQLRAGNLRGRAVAFVNPVDYANMRLTKAVSQGQLFVPAQSGAEIVEDNNVPVGYVQIALIDYYRILIYKDFTVSMGWENDDFTKNLVTFLGERRIHQFFNDAYQGAFIYDTLANIKAAIDAA